MKLDPTSTTEQHDGPLTLLEEFSLRANHSLNFARKHFGTVRRFFPRKTAPAEASSPPNGKMQLQVTGNKLQLDRPATAAPAQDPPKDPAKSAGGPGPSRVPVVPPTPPALEKTEKEPSANTPPGSPNGQPPKARYTVFLLSDEKKVIDAHPSCRTLLGWEPAELLGKAAGELFEKGADLLLEQVLKVPDADADEQREPAPKEPVELVALKKDGTTLRVKLTFRRSASLNCWTILLRPVEDAGEEEKAPESAPATASAAASKEPGGTVEVKPAAPEPSVTPATEAAGAGPKPEPAKPAPSEREMLLGRLMGNETELHHMRVQLEREARKRKELEQKMEELAATKAGPERPSIERGSSRPGELNDPATVNPPQATEAQAPAAETAAVQTTVSAAISTAEQKPIAGGELEVAHEVVAHQVDLVELERQLRASVASLARVTADYEKERSERRRSDQRATALADQLETLHHEFGALIQAQKLDHQRITELKDEQVKSEEFLSQAKAEAQKERAGRELAEEQLRGLSELSTRVEGNLQGLEEAKKAFKRAEQQMEARLQTSAKALEESEAKLQQETRECQRLGEALAKAQRELQSQAAQSRLEISKLEAGRHLEELKQRGFDSDKLRAHFTEVETRREGHELVNSLRQQARPPLETLHRSVCQLLQAELPENTQQALRSLLEPILLLQVTFQQPQNPNPGAEARASESQPATNLV